MRSWRKAHASILDSEQLAQISDSAALLFDLLNLVQDDTGYYPWTPTRIRRLTACRPRWTLADAYQYAEEIVGVGLAAWVDGGIVLIGGAERNGKPRVDVADDIYPRHVNTATETSRIRGVYVDATDAARDVCARVDEIRSKQIRSEESTAAVAVAPPTPQRKRAKNTTPDARVAELGRMLEAERGYESPRPAAEAKAAAVMLRQNHSPPDILACYRWLKAEEFWRDKPLFLSHVADNIGEWVKLGKPKTRGSNGRNGGIESAFGKSSPGNRPAGAFADLAERDEDM